MTRSVAGPSGTMLVALRFGGRRVASASSAEVFIVFDDSSLVRRRVAIPVLEPLDAGRGGGFDGPGLGGIRELDFTIVTPILSSLGAPRYPASGPPPAWCGCGWKLNG